MLDGNLTPTAAPMQVAGFHLDVVFHALGDTVVAAAHDEAGRHWVLKVLDSEQPSPELLARWRHEFDVLRRLDSPWVIRAEALLQAGRRCVLVLEGFGQGDLARLIAQGELSLGERLHLAVALAEAVSSVHAQGLLHGDIAPKNVLVDRDAGRLKLCDFGLACPLSHEARPNAQGFPQGTLAYLAPEQTGRTNLEVDQRSDFYALGATLYELFCGEPPFTTRDPLALLHAQLALRPPLLCDRIPNFPPALSDVVARLLEKAPEARYQSSHGLLRDLQHCLTSWRDLGRIPAFVTARHDVPERFCLTRRLVGREGPKAALLAAFDRACAGGNGLVLVSGAAGVGKSALVASLQAPVLERSGHFLRGKFDQFQRHRPYAALGDAFGPLMQGLAVEPDAPAWRDRLRTALGEHAAAVAELVPGLTLLTGPMPALPLLPPHEDGQRLHLAFARFVQALAQPARPLLLFLDDLQWADEATLQLLEMLLRDDPDAAPRALLVVGALREAEVDAQHPLVGLKASLRPGLGERLVECHLAPLSLADSLLLLAESLHAPPADCEALAALCQRKTGGNPFFLAQFLRRLHAQGQLAYDRRAGCWAWDLAAAQSQDVTENVVDLLLGQLRLLPPDTQQLLAQVAHLGDGFCGAELVALSALEVSEATQRLWPALTADLVQPLDERYRFSGSPDQLLQARYRFLHDRVQQAAHELTACSALPALQLDIGRRLRDHAGGALLEARLFTVLDALNGGQALITDAAERASLRQLNLRGARKARAAAAYPISASLARQALALNPEQDEQRLEAWLTLCEAEYLAGRFDVAQALFPAARAACAAPVAQAQVLAVQADALHLQGRFDEAFGVLREALDCLGAPFPESETEVLAAFALEFGALRQQLDARGLDSLMQAPELRDPQLLLQQRLLYALTYSTYQTGRFGAFVLDACRLLHITLTEGQSDLSAIAAVAFVTAMSAAKQPYPDCYALGAMALRMAEQRGNVYVRLTIYQYFNAFYQHWGAPLRDTLAPQDHGLAIGQAGVNPLSAGFCALLRCVNRFILGTPLPELQHEVQRSLRYLQSSHQPNTEAMLRHGVLQPLRALTLLTHEPRSFDDQPGQGYDALREQASPPGIPWALSSTAWLRHALLMDDATAWQACKDRVEAIATCLPDSPSRVEAGFFAALGALRWSEAPEACLQTQAERILLRQWARDCPANFEARSLLLEAEWARRHASPADPDRALANAMPLYARAIESASAHGWPVLEALANELYGRFWRDCQQPQLARQFVREAYHLYRAWGAGAKCRQLEAAWPQVSFRLSAARASGYGSLSLGTRSGSATEGPEGMASIDLQAVLKAHQLLSQEIHLDALLDQLFAVLLENAGAERGAIVLADERGLTVETCGSLEGEPRRVQARRLSRSLADCSEQLPVPVVELLGLTRELLVLKQPALDARFAHSPYLQSRRPASVLGLPIVTQGRLVALVYLENALLEEAFTARQRRMLELLATQAAISLVNARHVDDLEAKVAARTEELRQLTLRDGLTGIANRRAFDERLALEVHRAQRQGLALSLLMIDIDHFKPFNDHYGHQEGDRCIQAVARLLDAQAARGTDLAARYGGEEFALLLPETGLDDAIQLANDCVSAMAALALPHEHFSVAEVVTLSIGVTTLQGVEADAEQLVRRADAALYRAKREGRKGVRSG